MQRPEFSRRFTRLQPDRRPQGNDDCVAADAVRIGSARSELSRQRGQAGSGSRATTAALRTRPASLSRAAATTACAWRTCRRPRRRRRPTSRRSGYSTDRRYARRRRRPPPTLRSAAAPALRPGESVEVRPGDTLYDLSRHHHVSVAELMEVNSLSNPNLQPGQKHLSAGGLPRAAAQQPRAACRRHEPGTSRACNARAERCRAVVDAQVRGSYTMRPTATSLYGIRARTASPSPSCSRRTASPTCAA